MTPTDTTTPPVDPEPDEPDDVEELAQAIDLEENARKMVRAVLAIRSHDSDPSDRVQLAFDAAMIAACERIGRIMRSDLGAGGG
jgi:hypothetical protein